MSICSITLASHQVTLKVLLVRPEHVSNPGREEAQVLLSLLPLRLNIDQVHSIGVL